MFSSLICFYLFFLYISFGTFFGQGIAPASQRGVKWYNQNMESDILRQHSLALSPWPSKTFNPTSILYVSVTFFPSLKYNFIAFCSSKVSDCTFEIHQLCQSGFSRVYSNCCCSCLFEPEFIKIGQSSHKMYSNNIGNFQVFTTILISCTKKRLETYWRHHVEQSWTRHVYKLLLEKFVLM